MWLISRQKTRIHHGAPQQLTDCLQTAERGGKFLSGRLVTTRARSIDSGIAAATSAPETSSWG
jgi:hypothetical protein